jgi:hypothetical protein
MTATLVKVEDAEYDGVCSRCDRTGLRWIATVRTDEGTIRAGLECAKILLGWRTASAVKFKWAEHFTPVAEHIEHGQVWVLWQHRNGTATRDTVNGHLMSVGGSRAEWQRRGWLA